MKEAWEAQEKFTRKSLPVVYGVELGSPEQAEARTRLTKDYILSMVSELSELLHELPDWKSHRNPPITPVITSNVYEELADLQKFLWGLAMIWGLSYTDMEEQVLLKSQVVETRWRQERELPSLLATKRVAVVDIDGVLSPYPGALEMFRDKEFPGADLKNLEVREDIKREFRISGYHQTP